MITAIDVALTREQVFTHIDDVPPYTQTTFAVERMLQFCVANDYPIYGVPLTKEQAAFCLANRGVEAHRLLRLRAEDLQKPLLFIKWDTENHMLVDGSHRVVRLVSLGIFVAPAYIIQDKAVWETFIVADIPQLDPDTLLRSASGI